MNIIRRKQRRANNEGEVKATKFDVSIAPRMLIIETVNEYRPESVVIAAMRNSKRKKSKMRQAEPSCSNPDRYAYKLGIINSVG